MAKKLLVYSLFFLNLAIVVGFWWHSSGSLFATSRGDAIIALGRLAGLLAVNFVLLQFLIRGRAVWLEQVFGLNNLSRLHRLNGYVSISFILLHPSLLTIGYSMKSSVGIIAQFLSFILTYDQVIKAFIAACLFILIVFTSVYIVRRRLKYEMWYAVHLMTYLAIFLAWFHQLAVGGDFLANTAFRIYWYALYIFVFGNMLMFRYLSPLYHFWKHRFTVSQVAAETSDVTSIYLTGRNIEQFNVRPGQFMIFRFLSKEFWWQAHPFSLSMPMKDSLRITIKNCGDFTSKIASVAKGTQVIVDGPYGTFTKKAAQKEKFLLIAGGIGITPIRALTEQLAMDKKDIVVLYSNRNADIALKGEIDRLASHYHFPLRYFISDGPAGKAVNTETGRISGETILRLVPDVTHRDVYICGPPPMMDALIADLTRRKVPAAQLHFEKFSL